MSGFLKAGLLDQSNPVILSHTGGWHSLLSQTLSNVHGMAIPNNHKSLRSALVDILPESSASDVLDAAEWLVVLPTILDLI
jgi:hypothetical protein